jgi:hypothetical protein
LWNKIWTDDFVWTTRRQITGCRSLLKTLRMVLFIPPGLEQTLMWCEALAQVFQVTKKKEDIWKNIYVDLIVIHLSCSSFLVSVNLVSPALDEAMIPALLTSESVSVDLPWSTWAMTDMFLILHFRSMISRIWSTVKFTCKNKWKQIWKLNHSPGKHDLLNYCIS